MVRHKDVSRAGNDTLESFDGDTNAGGLENQVRPGSRTSMRKVAVAIPNARHDRRRTEHDGVDSDGGNQKKDRPPPMIRGNRHRPQDWTAEADRTMDGGVATGDAMLASM